MKRLKKALVMTVMLMAFLFGGFLSMDVQAGKAKLEKDDNVPGVDGCSIVLPEPELETQGDKNPEEDVETSGDEEDTENEDK